MDKQNPQIVMAVATAVIAVVAALDLFFVVINPQVRDLRQEIKDSEQRILSAIEQSEQRMLDALVNHRHDEDGQAIVTLPQ